MALTLRQNGLGQSNIVTASWWNDYYNLLTGVMTDQPVSLNYRPASSTGTPALQLASNGNAPLLIGLNSSGAQVFTLNTAGVLGFGPAAGGFYSFLQWYAAGGYVQLGTPFGGSANYMVFTTWNGTAAVQAFGLGSGAGGVTLAYIDNNGNLVFGGGGAALQWIAASHEIALFTPQSGAQNSIAFQVWTGSTGAVPLSIGSGGIGLATLDNLGQLTSPGLYAKPTSVADSVFMYNTAGTHYNSMGTNSGGDFFLFDHTNNGYVFNGLTSTKNVMTNRNGTQQANQVFTGANTPASPNVGDIWLNA